MQAFVLGSTALLVAALLKSAVGRRTVPLHRVASVRRVDDTTVRVSYADSDTDEVDVDALTEADADEAVEILRLKGVAVDGDRDADRGRAVETAPES